MCLTLNQYLVIYNTRTHNNQQQKQEQQHTTTYYNFSYHYNYNYNPQHIIHKNYNNTEDNKDDDNKSKPKLSQTKIWVFLSSQEIVTPQNERYWEWWR